MNAMQKRITGICAARSGLSPGAAAARLMPIVPSPRSAIDRDKAGKADDELDGAIGFGIKPSREIGEGKEADQLGRNLTADKNTQVTEELGAPAGQHCTPSTKRA